MSFFGFNTELPRDSGHPSNAPGFTQQADPFPKAADRYGGNAYNDDDDDGIEFDDTYDGLGDQLDETGDDLNDETFGGGPAQGPSGGQQAVGRDFDFFGQTAKVSNAITEEQVRYTRHQPAPKSIFAASSSSQKPSSKQKRTGYEKYQQPGDISDLQINPSLWGVAPKTQPTTSSHDRQQSSGSVPGRKMMSLEEVEAAMRAQPKKPSQPPAIQQQQQPQPPAHSSIPPHLYQGLPQQHPQAQPFLQGPGQPLGPPAGQPQVPQQILQRNISDHSQQPLHRSSPQPAQLLQYLQNPPQQTPSPFDPQRQGSGRPQTSSLGGSQGSLPLVTHPEQLLQLSGEQRTAYLMEDAKRAKRNHKIHLLSKDNGLMTPQDKNFITRIQLQQLVTATGNPNERGTDAGLAEDFYYQVHSQIRGGPRQNPNQPLSNFAQTYLFQTGSRQGGGRRHNRGADNHMQRMEQQVQRAVEAAKQKPKNKQLVIEGSLGKISFSNSKAPKPLLNIRRTEPGHDGGRPVSHASGSKTGKATRIDRNYVLRKLEQCYKILMDMEDLERHALHITPESDPEEIDRHAAWSDSMSVLNKKLWKNLDVMAPIESGSHDDHPFIVFLSYAKGKKAIPRVFRHLDQEQRLFTITVIFAQLGHIDAITQAQIQPDGSQLPLTVREEVELFSQAVIPSIFAYINEAPLNVLAGLFGLLMNSVNIQALALTKVGALILTTLASRAEIIKQAGSASDQDWRNWNATYGACLKMLEPVLPYLFPGSVISDEDVYVWQFLAAMAVGADPEQQQRLVLGIRERVLETVQQSKILPSEIAAQRISHVNLFMRAIGLDVDRLL